MTGECQDLAARRRVTGYVAGTLAPQETREFEAHLITCEWCQEEVRLAVAIRDELAAHSADATTKRRLSWVLAGGGAVAAAAAVILMARGPATPLVESLPSDHRAAVEAPAGPVPLFPVGAVETVAEARWTSLSVARSYRLTFVDQGGEMVWEVETQDTFAVLPETIRLQRRQPYFWKVEAQTGLERWVSSEFIRFELSPPSSPGH